MTPFLKKNTQPDDLVFASRCVRIVQIVRFEYD